MAKKSDITGQKFGRLTAIIPLNKRLRNSVVWLFKCDCGNEYETTATNVKGNRNKSCGCLPTDHANNIRRTLPDHQGPINKLYGNYRRGAERRNITFKLTKEEFLRLIKQRCYYCNSEFSNSFSHTKVKTDNIYWYNGVDRMDSSKGYDVENCVTCCKVCNKMKMDLHIKDFYKMIQTIYDHRSNEICETIALL